MKKSVAHEKCIIFTNLAEKKLVKFIDNKDNKMLINTI